MRHVFVCTTGYDCHLLRTVAATVGTLSRRKSGC
jgi:hypothetical protein